MKPHRGDDSREAIVVDVIEEAFHIEEQHTALEAQAVGGLNIVKEGEASVEAGGKPSTTELGCGDELVFHYVMLEALGDDLFH